jgi:hypothetical protein
MQRILLLFTEVEDKVKYEVKAEDSMQTKRKGQHTNTKLKGKIKNEMQRVK